METQATPRCDNWKSALAGEKEKPYFQHILTRLKADRTAGKTIYPPSSDLFNAFKYTPFDQVRVVIIGQDPYHGPKQAMGLAFSVSKEVAIPPSLKNIFQEIHDDLGLPIPQHGCLEKWARQGVLLLNTSLSVLAGQAASHANIGWEQFTDTVIKTLNEHCKGLIFLLWGSHAQRKSELIDPTRHFILQSTHPSPLSAHRGFLGCRHFSKTNQILEKQGLSPIDWSV